MTSQAFNVQPIQASNREQLRGLLAAFGTVAIWSSYFLSLKLGALSPLSTFDLSLLRFGIPALLLIRIFWKALPSYKQTPWVYRLGIILGGGLPFFVVSASAMKASGVLFGSTLIPGVAPLFVTLLAVTLFKQPLPKKRLAGLAAILVGTMALLAGAWFQGSVSIFIGASLFVVCAFSWALFTLSVRQSQLKPLQVSALAAVPNGMLMLALFAVYSPKSMLFQIPTSELIAQAFTQGILVGICSGLLYSLAISKLGAEKTSAIGSLTPLVSTLLAVIILNETLDIIPVLGLCLVATGVLLTSRVKTT